MPGANNELPARGEVLPIGKGRIVKKVHTHTGHTHWTHTHASDPPSNPLLTTLFLYYTSPPYSSLIPHPPYSSLTPHPPCFSCCQGESGKAYRAAILSIGTRLVDSVMAARALEARYPDLAVTVADARFMKPLDEELIRSLANERWVGGCTTHDQHIDT